MQNLGTKLNYLTIFLTQQCTLIDNASESPATVNIKTTKTLSSISVTRAEIANIITNYDANKGHRHDMISVQMQKLCGDSLFSALEHSFKSCLESETFPSEWKKANVFPVHKKKKE